MDDSVEAVLTHAALGGLALNGTWGLSQKLTVDVWSLRLLGFWLLIKAAPHMARLLGSFPFFGSTHSNLQMENIFLRIIELAGPKCISVV